MTPEQAQDAIASLKQVRVRGTHPSRAGWLGTVTGVEIGPGWAMARVRWDNPEAPADEQSFTFLSFDDVPPRPPRQPAPLAERPDLPHIADLVIDRLKARKAHGLAEYGTPLQPRNGRNALVDLMEELLDGAQYLEQLIWEQDHPEAPRAAPELHLPDWEPVVSARGRWFQATCSCGWRESAMRATLRTVQQVGRDHAIEALRKALQEAVGAGVVQQHPASSASDEEGLTSQSSPVSA